MINLTNEKMNEMQKREIVETVNKKKMEEREMRGEKKDEDVKVFAKSVRSLSL